MSRILLAILVLAVSGCATTNPTQVSSSGDSFQLHTGPDGRVYRIETHNGKTSWLDGTTYKDVSEPGMPQLVVGKIYRGEDGKATFRYNGVGQMEKWGIEKYMINQGQKKE